MHTNQVCWFICLYDERGLSQMLQLLSEGFFHAGWMTGMASFRRTMVQCHCSQPKPWKRSRNSSCGPYFSISTFTASTIACTRPNCWHVFKPMMAWQPSMIKKGQDVVESRDLLLPLSRVWWHCHCKQSGLLHSFAVHLPCWYSWTVMGCKVVCDAVSTLIKPLGWLSFHVSSTLSANTDAQDVPSFCHFLLLWMRIFAARHKAISFPARTAGFPVW